MKKNLRKVLAATLSTALLVGTPLTVMADAPTTTAGTGNILAYSVEDYLVPTSLSVALNPQGYDVTVRTGETVDDQVISLNYGVANLSSADKVLNVKLAVTGAEEITFVDSEEAISTTEGAPEMYLALVPGATLTMQDDTAFAVDDKAGANDHNVDADNLTDVKMTADDTAAVTFGGETDITAEQDIELDAAVYDVQDGETVDFTTTQAELATKMEIKTLGGIKGFTIKGAMNEKYDWTKLTAKTITLTPTYELIDAEEAAHVEELTATYDSTNTRYTIAVPDGVTLSDASDIRNLKVNGNAVATVTTNAAKTEIRIARSDIKAAIGDEAWQTTTDLEFTFTINGSKYSAASTK